MPKEVGAVRALVASDEARSGLHPTGFDHGERVRVILDCNWDDLQHALDMVIDAKPAFDRQGRVGWGWHWSRRGKPGLFVRRTKRGYSATAANALQSGAKGEE